MGWRLSLNVGFVTNSSTAIYHIPSLVLQDPAVEAFLSAYDIAGGYVGSDLLRRDQAESLLITAEQKAEALDFFCKSNEASEKEGWSSSFPHFDCNKSSELIAIYGDEYASVTHELVRVMVAALDRINKERGLNLEVLHDEYH